MSVAAMEQQIRVWGRAVEVQGQRVAAAVNDKMMAGTFDDALVETNLFVLALRDLARAAGTVSDLRGDAASAAAVAQFGNAIPDFNEIRIVIEHFDRERAVFAAAEVPFGARRSRRWTVVRGARSVVDLCADRRFGWSPPRHHWWVVGLSAGVFDVPPQSSGARSAIVWVKVQ